MRLKGKGASLAGRIGPTLFSNICFGKIEARPIMVPMDAIDIGNARTAAAAGQARPGACAGFGGGSCPGERSGGAVFEWKFVRIEDNH